MFQYRRRTSRVLLDKIAAILIVDENSISIQGSSGTEYLLVRGGGEGGRWRGVSHISLITAG